MRKLLTSFNPDSAYISVFVCDTPYIFKCKRYLKNTDNPNISADITITTVARNGAKEVVLPIVSTYVYGSDTFYCNEQNLPFVREYMERMNGTYPIEDVKDEEILKRGHIIYFDSPSYPIYEG